MIGFVIILALMIPLLAVILDSQLGRALAARLERGTKPDPALADRMLALEGEVDRLLQEVRRLDEETRFIQQLLESRAPTGGTLPPGEPEP
ncbi:MAG: hypothetical protein ACRELD_00405 [Longimicrobiales bacterium]